KHGGCSDDKGDANDRLLWHRLLGSAARPAEKRRAEKGYTEGDPEGDSIFEVISHQQRDTRTERCNLRQRKVDEDHLASDYVQSQVYEQWWKQQGGHERPFHDLPGQRKITVHFPPPSALAIARTRLSM